MLVCTLKCGWGRTTSIFPGYRSWLHLLHFSWSDPANAATFFSYSLFIFNALLNASSISFEWSQYCCIILLLSKREYLGVVMFSGGEDIHPPRIGHPPPPPPGQEIHLPPPYGNYGQCMGGTHPTGMHSCVVIFWKKCECKLIMDNSSYLVVNRNSTEYRILSILQWYWVTNLQCDQTFEAC